MYINPSSVIILRYFIDQNKCCKKIMKILLLKHFCYLNNLDKHLYCFTTFFKFTFSKKFFFFVKKRLFLTFFKNSFYCNFFFKQKVRDKHFSGLNSTSDVLLCKWKYSEFEIDITPSIYNFFQFLFTCPH